MLNSEMEEMKIVKIILGLLALCVALHHPTEATHHHIRHFRHKIVHINDHHVNEIREAFEDYKKTVKKSSSIDKSRLRELDGDDDLTQDASDYENEIVYENEPSLSKLQTTRHKRVDVYDSTLKPSTPETDNYDDDYDDDESAVKSKIYDAKRSGSGGAKVHVSLIKL